MRLGLLLLCLFAFVMTPFAASAQRELKSHYYSKGVRPSDEDVAFRDLKEAYLKTPFKMKVHEDQKKIEIDFFDHGKEIFGTDEAIQSLYIDLNNDGVKELLIRPYYIRLCYFVACYAKIYKNTSFNPSSKDEVRTDVVNPKWVEIAGIWAFSALHVSTDYYNGWRVLRGAFGCMYWNGKRYEIRNRVRLVTPDTPPCK